MKYDAENNRPCQDKTRAPKAKWPEVYLIVKTELGIPNVPELLSQYVCIFFKPDLTRLDKRGCSKDQGGEHKPAKDS